MEKGSIDVESSNHDYDHAALPHPHKYYMPVQCHQCSKPPCVKVCPVEATWQEPDGITVIDYDWCIGCRYCVAACPYWARRFNFAEPHIPDGATESRNGDISRIVRDRKESPRNALSVSTGRGRAGCRPVSKCARPDPANLATSWIPTVKSPTYCSTNESMYSKKKSAPFPDSSTTSTNVEVVIEIRLSDRPGGVQA